MLKKSEISKYPLGEVFSLTSELLVESEYMVDRLDITRPTDYLELRIGGDWSVESGTAIIKVTFVCDKTQSKALKELLSDDDKADDLDSGIGEAFEAAIAQIYPKKKWDYCVGKTEWAIAVKK